MVRPTAHVSKGCKSLIRPTVGMIQLNSKGVRREVKSEGS